MRAVLLCQAMSVVLMAYCLSLPGNVSEAEEIERLDVAVLERRIDKYCLTNNQSWRDTECRDIIQMLESGTDGVYQRKELRLLLARANGNLAKFEANVAERTTAAENERKIYETILDQDPEDVEVLYRYALSLPADRSVAVLQKLLELDPQHLNGRAILAAELQQLGGKKNLTEAAEHRRQVYRDETGSMKLYAAMRAYEAYRHADLPATAAEFRDSVKADFAVDDALRDLTSLTHQNVGLEQKITKAGTIIDRFCIAAYFMLEIVEPCMQATKLAENSSYEHPNDPRLLRLTISGLNQIVRYDASYTSALQSAYTRLLELEPESTEALYGYAQLLTGSKRFELLKKIVRLDQSASGVMHYSLAQEYMERGQPNEALEEFRKAFELAGPRYKRSFGDDLVRMLRNEGLDEEAMIVEKQLQGIG